jgi:CheY-like chemotaxis protein/HPt (histidine-containing phosphotransfer) domain-containing protein
LARAIKSDPGLAGVRLVLATSLDHRESPQAMREAGVQSHLVKPIKQSLLRNCLAMAISAEADILPSFTELEADPKLPVAVNGHQLRILIAEDNPVNQKVALHQLQRLGYEAQAVDNGRAALEALRRTNFDVIFMDCQMPELDGFSATREIRRVEGDQKHTWIVAVTANSLAGDRERCLVAGMDDYVSKPVKPDDLQNALTKFLARREDGRPPEPSDAPEPAAEVEPLPIEGTVLDLSLLSGFRDIDDGPDCLLNKLIDVFLDNSPKLLAEARTALNEGNAKAVGQAAHTLKGSCSNFGAERLRQACFLLEQAGGEGNLGRAPELLAAVEKEYNRARAALERERLVPTLA